MDMETQKIEATIKIEMIISNTNDTPVLRIDTIETTDVIINKTKVTPVTEIETTETMVTIIKVTRKTCHGIHITPIQIFYPNR